MLPKQLSECRHKLFGENSFRMVVVDPQFRLLTLLPHPVNTRTYFRIKAWHDRNSKGMKAFYNNEGIA